MESNMLILGNKVKRLREESNLTQKQLADFLSIDQSLVSKIEKGERSINSDLLEQISILFCCPIDALISSDSMNSTYTIAFRTNTIDNEDLEALAVINKIALNQFKMEKLRRGEYDD